MDGLRDTHDWFRKPGSFDCTQEKIGCIKRAGIRAVIMTTASGMNIDGIPALIDTVVEHKADVLAFARHCPTSEEKDVNIEPLRYRRLLADCDRKFKDCEAAGCDLRCVPGPGGQRKRWDIRTDCYAVMQLLLGYPREGGAHPAAKPRRNDRVLRL